MTDYTPTTETLIHVYALNPATEDPTRKAAAQRAIAAHDRETAAQALEQYATLLDQEHAEAAARSRVADARCLDCNLRYDERDQYSCGQPGHDHYYDERDLQALAAVLVEPTWDGDHARARATAIRTATTQNH